MARDAIRGHIRAAGDVQKGSLRYNVSTSLSNPTTDVIFAHILSRSAQG